MKVAAISKHDSRVESLARVQRKKVKLKTIACGALLAFCALLASSSPAMAQAGKLDSSFGIGGIFTDAANGFVSTGPFTNTQTFGTAVAVQSNGKIVAGGQIGGNSAVIRLNSNGTLDSTFGNGGTVSPILGGNDGQCQVIGLGIQGDGKIVVGITNINQGFRPMFIVARLNANGSLDTTYGSGGITETQLGPSEATASVFALQSDEKVLLAGSGFMARFDVTGQLDSTFGSSGVVTVLVRNPSAIALQPDGKVLLAAGGSVVGSALENPGVGLNQAAGVLARYNANGTLDTSFGIAGQVAALPVAAAIAVQNNSGCTNTCRILVGGAVASLSINGGNGFGFGVVRYNSNGSVDGTFGDAGEATTAFSPDATPFALAIQSNGDVVAAGSAGQAAFPAQADFALARYTGSGAHDSTFGSAGKITTAFGTNQAAIYALAVQSDGKILAVGGSLSSSPNPGGIRGGLVVARYLPQ